MQYALGLHQLHPFDPGFATPEFARDFAQAAEQAGFGAVFFTEHPMPGDEWLATGGHDALVTVMETKYHYNFWRPETAIPAGDSDGNPRTSADSTFVPFVATPCFPSYPSAHASASYAARTVLEKIYGHRPLSMTLSTPALPDVTLHYVRLEQITDDIDDARVYGGIHFRFDQEAGAVQGRRLGRYVVAHNLKSTGSPHHSACEPDESFKTCLLRAIRQHKLKRALEHRRQHGG